MQVLTTTKRLDVRLSKMFSSWGRDTGIDLSKLIEAILWDLHAVDHAEKYTLLLHWRLRCPTEAIRICEDGLTIKIDDDQWLEITPAVEVGIVTISAPKLNVRYWL